MRHEPPAWVTLLMLGAFLALAAWNVATVVAIAHLASLPVEAVAVVWVVIWSAVGWALGSHWNRQALDWWALTLLLGPGGLLWLIGQLDRHWSRYGR